MCNKVNNKGPNTRIDKCMKTFITHLNLLMIDNFKTVACCCGHGKYNMTIIVEDNYGNHFDLITGCIIERKRKFYKRDNKGYYYIPETINQ